MTDERPKGALEQMASLLDQTIEICERHAREHRARAETLPCGEGRDRLLAEIGAQDKLLAGIRADRVRIQPRLDRLRANQTKPREGR